MPTAYYVYMYKCIFLDKRFSTISRIAGGVEASVNILKSYYTHSKIAGMVVQVMKVYAVSGRYCFFSFFFLSNWFTFSFLVNVFSLFIFLSLRYNHIQRGLSSSASLSSCEI